MDATCSTLTSGRISETALNILDKALGTVLAVPSPRVVSLKLVDPNKKPLAQNLACSTLTSGRISETPASHPHIARLFALQYPHLGSYL